MDAESAFLKMRENERLKKEDNPFDDSDKVKRPLYRGLLIYEHGKKVEYFRLLNLDQFVYKQFTPLAITMKTGRNMPIFGVMSLSEWLRTVNNELRYTQAEGMRYEGLPDEIKSDKIKYLSENARDYGSPPEGEPE